MCNIERSSTVFNPVQGYAFTASQVEELSKGLQALAASNPQQYASYKGDMYVMYNDISKALAKLNPDFPNMAPRKGSKAIRITKKSFKPFQLEEEVKQLGKEKAPLHFKYLGVHSSCYFPIEDVVLDKNDPQSPRLIDSLSKVVGFLTRPLQQDDVTVVTTDTPTNTESTVNDTVTEVQGGKPIKIFGQAETSKTSKKSKQPEQPEQPEQTQTTTKVAPQPNPTQSTQSTKYNYSEVKMKPLFKSNKLELDNIKLSPWTSKGDVPILDTSYQFKDGYLNEVLAYLSHPLNDCLYIAGPAGCGKTSLIMQVCARLQWGLQQITVGNKTEVSDLIGHTVLRKGELEFEYGVLVKAMLNGDVLLINEIDTMSPSDLSVLNDVLEGKPLTITANNGEIIKAHPNFRVVATANTIGNGDDTGAYVGTRQMNTAFMDRFRYLCMDYLTENEEAELVLKVSKVDKDTAQKLAKFSHDLRELCNGDAPQISAPFSSRALIKIAKMLEFRKSVMANINSFYALRLPKAEQEFIGRLVTDIFGNNVA